MQIRGDCYSFNSTFCRVGKLDSSAYKLGNEESEPTETIPTTRVGKLNVESLFQKEERKSPETTTIARVGKLNVENMFQKEESKSPETPTTTRVGKLNVENMFQKEEIQTKPAVRVGKLNTKETIFTVYHLFDMNPFFR